jgi:hypothetical protein
MLSCKGPIGDVEMTPLEPPTMSPQEIPKTGSFEDDMEWKELNMKSIIDEVNIKMEESDWWRSVDGGTAYSLQCIPVMRRPVKGRNV